MQFETSDSARLLSSDDVSEEFATTLLEPVGFDDWQAALGRIRGFCRDGKERQAFAATLPSLLYALTDAATPDASLVNFERYVQAVPSRIELFQYLAANPRAVEILVRLFVGSQFLTEILLRNPSYLERLTQHKRLAEFKHRQELIDEARRWAQDEPTLDEKMNAVRRFQKWELLRLAACDTFRLMDLKTVTLQLALLADSLVAVCLGFAADDLDVDPEEFSVLAFGKLGGEELNYSSDIDLVFVCESHAEKYWGLGQKLIKAIQDPTSDGFLYRVDMRLRPWGRSGPLVTTADSYVDYIRKNGRLWEKQALLKSRVIAGSQRVGQRVLKRLEPFIYDVDPEDVRRNVLEMKQQIEENLRKHRNGWGQVKAGAGSIRDVEFVTQYLQLAHGKRNKAVRSINTLDGLVRLADLDILHADEYRHLSGGYVFLRTIEHSLQLMHNKQQHALPESRRELDYLARRLDFPGATEFVSHYERHCRSIRRIFEKYIIAPPGEEEDPLVFKPRTVAVHLGDAASTYEELFSREQAERHLALLDRLDDDTIVKIDTRSVADGRWELTIVGYDQLGDLSLICGLLFVFGFDIESGYVFTGTEVVDPGRNRPARNRRQVVGKSPRRRKYVNVFTVRPTANNVIPAIWGRYENDLAELLSLAQQGKHRDASGRLAKRVAATLDPSEEDAATDMLLPVEIDIDNESAPDATVMHIRAEDTPGFLYELANALAHSNISIVRMQIRSEGPQVIDTLYVTDQDDRKIEDPEKLNELRAAVVLIKHFTHLLPHSPNPEAALIHFREFLEQLFELPHWVEELGSLQDSDVLNALARLLGVSDFLWHDFLRLQHDNLFPVVTDLAGLQQPRLRSELDEELQQELAEARNFEERKAVLNAFKDREMLRVDMRHILGLQTKFGMFSGELADVAEAVVRGALQIAEAELRPDHGQPLNANGEPCQLSVCALGKCGGRELGYASDIELMFVYDEDGHTSGRDPIQNIEYFQKLVEKFRKAIHAKRQGIFEIDLRLRPYGKAGSLAVSLETFEKYFAPDGPAWPYERQALVKLRPIAGDPFFGRTVVATRDRIVYTGEPFDVAAMRAMRDKQISQLVQAGTFNAKLSPGGLVDCEYLVQGLQITFGHRDPSLRQTNTREAMKALEAAGFLEHEDRIHLRDAYRFLRRVIDGLRMVRGDARDLTVPPADSEEFEFLARRLGYGRRVDRLAQDLEDHTQKVLELGRRLDVLIESSNG